MEHVASPVCAYEMGTFQMEICENIVVKNLAMASGTRTFK